MSGTYSTALTVKQMILEKHEKVKIEIVDSKSNCMQLGFAVLAGAKAIKKGKDIESVVSAIKDNILKSRMLFIPETLDYLKRSGRLSKASAIAASLLKIFPVLTVFDGKADVFAKIRTRKKAIESIIFEFKQDINSKGLGEVIIIHIDNETEANELKETLKEKSGKNIEIGSIGPVIGAHVGPGTLGITYYTK